MLAKAREKAIQVRKFNATVKKAEKDIILIDKLNVKKGIIAKHKELLDPETLNLPIVPVPIVPIEPSEPSVAVNLIEPKVKTKKKVLFYTQTEYNDWTSKNDLKNYEIKYKKGLAALVDDEYQDIINSPKMTLISKDDMSANSLDIWFGKNSDLRKTELLK